MIWCWFVENKEILQALGPFAIAGSAIVVGLITVVITLHFNRRNLALANLAEGTNKRRVETDEKNFNFALFDKRYPVFEGIRAGYMATLETSDSEEIKKRQKHLYSLMPEADFLFPGDTVSAALENCKKFLRDTLFCRLEMEQIIDSSPKDEPGIRKQWELQEKLLSLDSEAEQKISELQEIFAPYLKITDVFPR